MTTRIFNYFNIIKRNHSSALYITGNKAQNNFVVLIPHIDFEERLKNRNEFIHNLQARQLNINLNEIEKKWNYFCMLNDKRRILEATRDEIAKIVNDLKNANNETNREEIEKLLLHSKIVRDDLRSLRDYLYGIEEDAALSVLELPNVLNEKTPIVGDKQIYQFNTKPNHSAVHHLSSNNLIEYHSPMFCYLKSNAALFEYAISNYFQSSLLENDFQQFSNADFVRSLIIDGCGNNYYNNTKIFTLHNRDDKINDLNRLHLIGGSSLESFMAYFARHTIQSTYFPLKLFTYGRKYQPIPDKSIKSLFNLTQQSVLTCFIAYIDDDDDCIIDDLQKTIVGIYERFNCHFRLVYKAAYNLENCESCRLSIQMYSNHSNDYIEIGNLSIYDDYISKRLLFNYKDKDKVRKYPKIIAGNILNVQKMLGCLIENNNSISLDGFLRDYL